MEIRPVADFLARLQHAVDVAHRRLHRHVSRSGRCRPWLGLVDIVRSKQRPNRDKPMTAIVDIIGRKHRQPVNPTVEVDWCGKTAQRPRAVPSGPRSVGARGGRLREATRALPRKGVTKAATRNARDFDAWRMDGKANQDRRGPDRARRHANKRRRGATLCSGIAPSPRRRRRKRARLPLVGGTSARRAVR